MNEDILKNVRLKINYKCSDNVSSDKIISNIKLNDKCEKCIDLLIPIQCYLINLTLQGDIVKVSKSQTKYQTFFHSQTFEFNQINTTDSIQQFHLLPINFNSYNLFLSGLPISLLFFLFFCCFFFLCEKSNFWLRKKKIK